MNFSRILQPVPILTVLVIAHLVVMPLMWQRISVLQAQVATLRESDLAPIKAPVVTTFTKIVHPITNADHVQGSKDAEVILLEYSDTECPFCKQFEDTIQQAQKEYGSKIARIYRPYPLSFHQNAQKEAEASECVAEQGGDAAFFKYMDAIFTRTTSNGSGFSLTALAPLATEQGLDGATLQECIDSGKYATKVSDSEKTGSDMGVNGTPGTFILKKDGTGLLLPGAVPYSLLKSEIDKALK
jgi:protein-disulfide isomerase